MTRAEKLSLFPTGALALAAAYLVWRAPGALAIARLRSNTLGWIIASLLVVIAVRPALSAPRNLPVVDLDLYEAAKCVRSNVGQSCVDYLVNDAETAYWLHIAVLGNPRSSPRMEEIDRYEPRAAVGPWITAAGRGYAIADARTTRW